MMSDFSRYVVKLGCLYSDLLIVIITSLFRIIFSITTDSIILAIYFIVRIFSVISVAEHIDMGPTSRLLLPLLNLAAHFVEKDRGVIL